MKIRTLTAVLAGLVSTQVLAAELPISEPYGRDGACVLYAAGGAEAVMSDDFALLILRDRALGGPNACSYRSVDDLSDGWMLVTETCRSDGKEWTESFDIKLDGELATVVLEDGHDYIVRRCDSDEPNS